MADASISYMADYEEYTLIQRLKEYYSRAKSNRQRYHEEWKRNYSLLNNKMWSNFRPTSMPSPQDNEILPIYSSVRAWMTDQHIEFNVIPSVKTNGLFYPDASKRANDLETVLHSNFQNLNWGREVNLTIGDGLLFGTGILKSLWNQALDSGIGNANMIHVPIWDVYIDPNASNDQDCAFIIEAKRMSLDEIERRWPDTFDKLLRTPLSEDEPLLDMPPSPGLIRPRAFANPSTLPSPANTPGSYGLPGQSRITTGRYQDVDSLNVYECWFKENFEAPVDDDHIANENSITDRIIYDRWRIVVYASGIVLFDEYADDVYGFNDHPYSRYAFEDIGEFYGIPLVSMLAPCQIAINRILAAVQQNIELTGNPVWMDVANSGISRTAITNRPGTRLTVRGAAAQANNRPGWINPPQFNPQMLQTIDMWRSMMKNIAGLSDVSRGQMPAGRNAQQTVQQGQEAGFVRVRSGQRNLEYTLRRCGAQLAALIVQNYDTPRMVAIVGDTGTESSLALASKHFYSPNSGPDSKVTMEPLKYSLLVDAGSDNPTSRQARIAESDTLKALGAIDNEALLQAHNFPNYQNVLERMQKAEQEAMLMGMMKPGGGSSARAKAGRTK